MFIVSLPIAVKVGGSALISSPVGEWWSVFAMMGVPYICYWTGVLLIECLYEKDKKVAEFYRPGFCKWVLAAQLTELLSTCIIYLLLAADLLQSCFPSIGMVGGAVAGCIVEVLFLSDVDPLFNAPPRETVLNTQSVETSIDNY
ncbi:hypothetical protein Q1695_004709 [Nippostrongylus brasiliensis]|nr:hypothetical protein Q1695_004709 [Nippostrongylus brasiliensis]